MAKRHFKEEGLIALKEQALHYHHLGRGKPEEHEYNLRAEGLKFAYNVMHKTRSLFGMPEMEFDE